MDDIRGKFDLARLRARVMAYLQPKVSAFEFQAYVSVIVEFRLRAPDELIMVVPNQFVAKWYDARLLDELRRFVIQETGMAFESLDVVWNENGHEGGQGLDLEPQSDPERPTMTSTVLPRTTFGTGTGLNPKYRMETFVVGDSNRFSHACSLAVATSPGTTYNPLFLYGGVGLGKTHLMQAVGHKLIELGNLPADRVIFVTSEIFCNEYIQAIGQKLIERFRQTYRKAAALLIDDVQFFGGKEKLQEEFFHTFNEMYQAGRQIVMTSDRPPAMLENLQERLVSRFKSGVVTDIKPPDLETKTAILTRLAAQQGIELGFDCLSHLAELVKDNIRELEGAFTKIVAMSSFMNVPITRSMIDEVLVDFARSRQVRKVNIELIQRLVCEHFGVRHEELVGKRKIRRVVVPRQVAMYLAHDMTDETLQSIGRAFGDRDHTTVLHAFNKIGRDLESGSGIAGDVKVLRIRLREQTQT